MYLTLLNGFEIPETRASLRQESANPFAPASHSWLETVAPSSTVLTFGTATGRPGVDAPSLGFGPPALLVSAAPALNLGTATPQPASAATEPSSLPWASYNQIADYMIRRGYSFNLGDTGPAAKSNTIRYNLDGFSSDENGLNADGKKLARAAIGLYEEVLGIDFVETSGDAEIYFRDNQDFAFANTFLKGDTGYIRRSVINIPSFWLEYRGEEKIGGYTFQTYLHEIGHALGLRHPGPYGRGEYYYYVTSKDDPNYGRDSNVFLNDSWQASLMSYIDQRQNTEVDASFAFVITPMIADWKALGKLYGLSGEAFSGDTVWGFNTNVDNAALRNLRTNAKKKGFTIVDADGVDKIDFSGFGHDQKIDLRENAISNVGGKRGNMLIADGTIIENARSGEGDDTLQGNGSDNKLVAGDGNDILRAGNGRDTLLGGEGDDELIGERGADTLDGGRGSDKMRGGAGSDTYYVDTSDDIVIEASGGGKDTVFASESYRLGAYQENLTLDGPSGRYHRINGTGNGSENIINGDGGINILDGADAKDQLFGKGGNDSLAGGSGSDELFGGQHDDELDGGAGGDLMQGDGGNDTFVVDNSADRVLEKRGEGTADKVISWKTSYTLPSNVEDLKLKGTAEAGIGNGENNSLTGNGLSNFLSGIEGDDYIEAGNDDDLIKGGRGEDTLYGGSDNDTLRGGSGNDTLVGQSGTDELRGGTGDDYYKIESSNDLIIENRNEGYDHVSAYTKTYTLTDNVESLRLFNKGARGFGNAADNLLIGDDSSQTLNGAGGDDTLEGGWQSALLKGANGDDELIAGQGGNQKLFGGSGNDLLVIGLGDTRLNGGAGDDTFRFLHVGRDPDEVIQHTIRDFEAGEDKIDFTSLLSGFYNKPVLDLTWIGGAKFSGEAREIRFHDSLLRMDVNFDREVDLYIEIDIPTLSESDFIL